MTNAGSSTHSPLTTPKTLFELSPSSPPFLYLDPQPTLILAA